MGEKVKHNPTNRECEVVASTKMVDGSKNNTMIMVQFEDKTYPSFVLISDLETVSEER